MKGAMSIGHCDNLIPIYLAITIPSYTRVQAQGSLMAGPFIFDMMQIVDDE
jgi:hypothetical protein